MKKFVKIVAVIGLLASISVTSCTHRENVAISCEAKEILLDKSFFPPSAIVGTQISPLPEGGRDSIGITIYLEQGIFVQQVFPSFTTRGAESQFNDELRDPVFNIKSTWSEPDKITNMNIESDDYRVACGMQNNIPMCRAILQQDHYYVFVNAHTSETEFSSSDFSIAIQEIDKRIQSCTEENK